MQVNDKPNPRPCLNQTEWIATKTEVFFQMSGHRKHSFYVLYFSLFTDRGNLAKRTMKYRYSLGF